MLMLETMVDVHFDNLYIFWASLNHAILAEQELMAMEVNDQTVEGVLNICLDGNIDLHIRMSAVAFLKTTFSKIYNVS